MILEVLDSGRPDQIAIAVSGGASVTYAGLRQQVDRLVRQLNGFGLASIGYPPLVSGHLEQMPIFFLHFVRSGNGVRDYGTDQVTEAQAHPIEVEIDNRGRV